MKIAIIVPCYNEEQRLNLKAFEKNIGLSCDFYFVNDGSTDRTGEMIKVFCAGKFNFFAVDTALNSGKAEAVRLGINTAAQKNEYDWLGFWDADLATPLDEIPKFVHVAINNFNLKMIIGSRWLRLGADIRRNPLRHYLGRFFATTVSLLLKLPVYDTQCGAKMFHKSIIDQSFGEAFTSKWFFDVEIFFRLKKHGHDCLKICYEHPLFFWEDKKGSKLKLTDFIRAPLELLKIKSKY